MANRLTKITTRTGDDGTTGLGDGSRRPKHSPRIAALGDIDELNSALGVLLAEPLDAAVRSELSAVQQDLFDLGGEVSIPGHIAVAAAQVARLDTLIEQHNGTLPPLKEFILPSGCRAAALCHVARAVCRRAERSLSALAAAEAVSPLSLRYLNRLSDWLFILSRVINRQAGVAEVCWQPRRE